MRPYQARGAINTINQLNLSTRTSQSIPPDNPPSKIEKQTFSFGKLTSASKNKIIPTDIKTTSNFYNSKSNQTSDNHSVQTTNVHNFYNNSNCDKKSNQIHSSASNDYADFNSYKSNNDYTSDSQIKEKFINKNQVTSTTANETPFISSICNHSDNFQLSKFAIGSQALFITKDIIVTIISKDSFKYIVCDKHNLYWCYSSELALL